MRVLLIALALALAVAASALAAANSSYSNAAGSGPAAKATMSSSNDIDACLMGCLNLDQSTLDGLRSQGWKTPDIVMAAVVSMRSGVAINDILAQYKACSNWRDVARQYNLSVADVMKFRMTDDQDMDSFNKALLSQCYCIAECDVAAMRAKGMSWSEICMSATAAARTGQTIMTIADLRSQGMTWEQIACKFNISPSDICVPVRTASTLMTRTYAGAGPMMPPANVRDCSGNIIMTEDMANRWYLKGYDWLDVAVATNIAVAVNYPVAELMILSDAGYTWRYIATKFGVCPEVAFNVCGWPFPRRTIYSQSKNERNLRQIEAYQQPMELVGAGPGGTCQMPYWLQQSPTWFGSEWCRPCSNFRPCDPCAPCPAPCPVPACPVPACPTPATQ